MSVFKTGSLFTLAAALPVLLGATAALADPAYLTVTSTLRQGPGQQYAPIVRLRAGTPVDVEDCDYRWCEIRVGRYAGYVRDSVLNFAGGPRYAPPIYQPGPPVYQPGPPVYRPPVYRPAPPVFGPGPSYNPPPPRPPRPSFNPPPGPRPGPPMGAPPPQRPPQAAPPPPPPPGAPPPPNRRPPPAPGQPPQQGNPPAGAGGVPGGK